jgi:hypothetical protein
MVARVFLIVSLLPCSISSQRFRGRIQAVSESYKLRRSSVPSACQEPPSLSTNQYANDLDEATRGSGRYMKRNESSRPL